MQKTDTWFATTLIFVSEIAEISSVRPLCEERVALFHVKDELTALAEAITYGEREQHSYLNAKGEPVRWRFVGVEKTVELLPTSNRGWEVATRYTRRSWRTIKSIEATMK